MSITNTICRIINSFTTSLSPTTRNKPWNRELNLNALFNSNEYVILYESCLRSNTWTEWINILSRDWHPRTWHMIFQCDELSINSLWNCIGIQRNKTEDNAQSNQPYIKFINIQGESESEASVMALVFDCCQFYPEMFLFYSLYINLIEMEWNKIATWNIHTSRINIYNKLLSLDDWSRLL